MLVNLLRTQGSPSVIPTQTYRNMVLQDSPSLYYGLDDSSYSTTIDLINGNNATFDADSATHPTLEYESGMLSNSGSSYYFGGGQYIIIPSSYVLPGNTDLTIEFLSYVPSSTNFGSLFSIGGEEPRIQAHAPWGDTLYWDYNGAVYRVQVDYTAYKGAWAHVVLKARSNYRAVYINGELKLESFTPAPLIATDVVGGFIGKWADYFHTGGVDEFAIYHYDLPEENIINHHAYVKGYIPPAVGEINPDIAEMPATPYLWLDMNLGFEEDNKRWIDSSGNNRHGTQVDASKVPTMTGSGVSFDGTGDSLLFIPDGIFPEEIFIVGSRSGNTQPFGQSNRSGSYRGIVGVYGGYNTYQDYYRNGVSVSPGFTETDIGIVCGTGKLGSGFEFVLGEGVPGYANLNGYIKEVILFENALTTPERDAVTQYLASKHGISI